MTRRIDCRLPLKLSAILMMVATPAFAQVVGGPVEFADPGKFSGDLSVGDEGSTMGKFNFGLLTTPGGTITGNALEEGDSSGIAAGATLSYGVGDILNEPGEIWGRFDYSHATDGLTSSPTGSFLSATFVPFLDGVAHAGFLHGAFLTIENTGSLKASIDENNYDSQAGIRLHYNVGGFTLAPTAYLGYEHVGENQNVGLLAPGTDVSAYDQNADLSSDIYRIGVGLGADKPLTPSFTWINFASASLDYVHGNFNAAETATVTGFSAAVSSSAASGSDNGLGGTFSLNEGLSHESLPGFSQFVMGSAQYMTRVPYVSYPTPTDAGTTTADHPAQLATTGQVSYGVEVGLSLKF